MALADQKYDVKINGQGFILVEESYRRRAQQPFAPRFSTGDPSFADLSFWQFLTQEDFGGGVGQDDFVDTTKIKSAIGWDLSTGKPKLAGGTVVTSVGTAPWQIHRGFSECARLHRFGKIGYGATGRIVLAGLDAGDVQDAAHQVLRAATATDIGIDQVRSKCAQPWQRITPAGAEGGRFLCCTHAIGGPTARGVRFFDEAWNIKLTASATSSYDPQVIIPINHSNILILGTGWLGGGVYPHLYYDRMEVPNDWGGVGNPPNVFSGGSGDWPMRLSSSWAKDQNGSIYVAGAPDPTLNFNSDHGGSTIGIFTAEDVLENIGPYMSNRTDYPDFIISGLVSVSGVVYILGVRVLRYGAGISFRNQVLRFPDTLVWEDEEILGETRPRYHIEAMSQESYHEAFFIAPHKGGTYDSIMRISSAGRVEEFAILPAKTPGPGAQEDNTWMALIRTAGSIYAYESRSNDFEKASLELGTTKPLGELVLETSAYGGNTPLIDKTPYALLVELSKVIPAGEQLDFYINDVLLGSMLPADLLNKTFSMPADLTAKSFIVKVKAASTVTWDGELERLTLQFIPTQFKKMAWGMALRCDRNLRLADGSPEETTPTELMAKLKEAWLSNTPVPFVDLDASTKQVIVTDWDERRPLINRDGEKEEAFVFLELLEV